MQYISVTEKCMGCGACAANCPVNAITMTFDRYGFHIPVINHNMCKKCGLCIKTCPVENIVHKETEICKVYAAYNKNEYERMESSSGGVFTVFASCLLEQGGYVVGAVYDGVDKVKHIVTNDMSVLKKMRGSKYIQSHIGKGVYRKIRELLKEGKTVLFTGTGCQNAAIKRYLKKDYDKLICMDVLCHGIASSEIWNKYLAYLSSKYNANKILSVNMRDKSTGWDTFSMTVMFDSYLYKERFYNKDLFGIGHCRGFFLRDSCDSCQFKRETGMVVTDISIGDYWGGNDLFSDAHEKGISVIILNTGKGLRLFRTIQDKLVVQQHSIDEAAEYNCVIKSPDPPYKRKKQLFKEIESQSFEVIVKKHIKKIQRKENLKWKLIGIKCILSKFIPDSVKKVLKRGCCKR